MRALLVIAALTIGAATARADVAPDPGRPEFDTPQPMPDPLETTAAGVVLAAALAFVLARRKRA